MICNTRYLVVSLVLFSSACTFVELKPEAESVAVVGQDAVTGCDMRGRVSVRTQASIGFIDRGSEKLQNELATLARNEAVVLGANRLVPDSLISEDGAQQFRAYACKE